jgi:hypothetical protein
VLEVTRFKGDPAPYVKEFMEERRRWREFFSETGDGEVGVRERSDGHVESWCVIGSEGKDGMAMKYGRDSGNFVDWSVQIGLLLSQSRMSEVGGWKRESK